MESLALLIFVLFCAVFLCGPFAYALAYFKFNILAILVGGLAIFLGIYWFGTIYTWAKYLGAISAVIGLLALMRVTSNFYDK
jgi:hypothetical protein